MFLKYETSLFQYCHEAESKVKPQKKLINGCKIFHKPVSLAISALKSVTESLVHPASTSSRPERSWLAHFATLSLGFCLILKQLKDDNQQERPVSPV